MARKKLAPMLITFEGTEGAGKTTLISAVADIFKKHKRTVTVTREPGGSKVAEKIRSIILLESMAPLAELFLYEAARAEHMAKTVSPALKRGSVVLCDRFTDSSLAYQSYARGLPWKMVRELNNVATSGRKPDYSVFIDVDPAKGLKNARERNRFEKEGVKFQTKVRRGFLKIIKEEPNRWIVLKAYSDTPERMAVTVFNEILRREGVRCG